MDSESLNKKYAKELALLDREVINKHLKEKIEQWWKNRPRAIRNRYYNTCEIEHLDINKEYNDVSNWLLEIFSLKEIKFGTDENPDENSIYLDGKLVFSIDKYTDKYNNKMVLRTINSKYIRKRALELIR